MDGDLFANLPQHTRHQGNHLPTLATSKPQPAADRSAILGFLDRPRTAKAVADHIGRRLSATTKRLEVLVERRLAVTTRHGLYVRTKLGKLRATASAAELRVSSSKPLEKREKILAFLNKKRATVEVAAHIGLTRDTTSRLLADMGRRYLVVRVGWGIWLRADCRKANSGDTDVAGTTTKPTRPQPIRDAILAFLVEPKSAKEVATHINRPVPVATGHLRAMRSRALVVRVSWGVWVRRDCCDNAPDPSTIRRNFPAQEALLRHLSEPRTLEELEQASGTPRSTFREALTKLVDSGAVLRQSDDRYARAPG
jgi:hypothetical protein